MSFKIDGSGGVTFPDSSVQNKSAQGPTFSVYNSAPQAVPASTLTKLNFNTKEVDFTNAFDTATSRFQPTVAGWYQINGGVTVSTTQCTMQISIYKSTGGAASEVRRGSNVYNSGAAAPVASLVYLNGTTDYLELWAFFSVAQNTGNASAFTYFQGFLARAA